jgi:AAHS family 4-hydroxybenzoate transporter-like MFS transporter
VQLEGIEIVLISIIFPFINKEWNLTENQKIMITQSIFIGILIGNLIGGYLGDKIGRKHAVNSGMLLSLLLAFISAHCYSFEWFLLTRTLTNVGVGMIIANANTMVTELY